MLEVKAKIGDLLEAKKSGLPMKTRLFFFLAALVVIIITGVVIVLFINGTLSASLAYNRNIIAKDLHYAADSISTDYGRLSVQAINFARELAGNIENRAAKLGFAVEQIGDHPELLEEIIGAEYDTTNFFLQTSKGSGAFFILDATVNPYLPGAENSRAGFYLKNMEPNIVSASTPNLIVFRGFPGIARSNKLSLHSLWNLEFNISDAPYYWETIAAAKANPSLPLSRLYYWSSAALTGAGEKVMLCTVPLLAKSGYVFGLAGLEISEMLFKLSYLPNNSVYKRLFCTLSPVVESSLDLTQSMIAGGYSAVNFAKKYNHVSIGKNKHALTVYQHESNISFLGLHEFIDLYPQDSLFAQKQWAVVVMAPEYDIVSSITRTNFKLYILLLLLLLFGIGASLYLTKKYLEPIDKGLSMIKSSGFSTAQRTYVPELDDLVAFLEAHQKAVHQKALQENLYLQVLDEFLENTKTLSPAERRVFQLFVKGYKVSEIAALLNLSVNTIKTHNKHIFQKLDIASREELILYVRMLKEIGKDIEN